MKYRYSKSTENTEEQTDNNLIEIESINLPLNYKRPHSSSYQEGEYIFSFPTSLMIKLHSLSSEKTYPSTR